MVTVYRLPNITALVEPLLGTPYARFDCWALVRHLLIEGFDLDIAQDPQTAATAFSEIWYRGDARDPAGLIQPWDLLLTFRDPTLPVSTHVGLALDPQTFVHARDTSSGVAIERVRHWRPRLLQLARLRRLL